jgi:hypothetical protein
LQDIEAQQYCKSSQQLYVQHEPKEIIEDTCLNLERQHKKVCAWLKITLPGKKVGGIPYGAIVGGNPVGATVGGIPTVVFWLWEAKGDGGGGPR